jgi:hypothetical protein
MKKLSLLLGILFIGLMANGHVNHGKSDLKLKLWDNSIFQVTIDNHKFNKSTNLNIGNLKPGIHYVKITKRKRNRHNHQWVYQILYKGSIRIPKNSVVRAVVTPHRKLELKIRKKKHNHNVGYGSQQNQGCNHYGDCNSSCGNNDESGYYGNSYNDYQFGMNEQSFNQLLNATANETFDDGKISIVRQALRYNDLSTDQVILLVKLFTFDSGKLEVAKMAFRKAVDKENYYLVSNEFTFSRSKNKLNDYINNYQS